MTAPLFVQRDEELAHLDDLLDRARAGKGQVAFVTGEPGAGKTSLVAEFARRAEERHADLLYAYADCDARTGAGDAYLPFRELLALLAGDTEAEVAQGNITEETASRLQRFLRTSGEVVFEAGTEVLGAFIPGAGLVAKLAALVARRGRTGGDALAPARIQEQYTRIIQAAAERHPLVLAIDDLQWADAASLDLFFHLGRRLEGSRVLLLGSYRPNDVARGRDGERHPLEPVVAELQRYGADVSLSLDDPPAERRRAFIEALLAARPNRFDRTFVDRLVEHTGGHALFAVEVLAALEARGDIRPDAEGVWGAADAIDWARIPSRVEGVIAERVARLDPWLRASLEVGSVEGDEFSAEIIARVRESDRREVVRRLSSEGDRTHRLVAARGLRSVGGVRLSAYEFRHALFHRYIYGAIDTVERALLHEEVGRALEELLGENREELAPRLAAHFTEAGDPARAVPYLLAAGRRALDLSAYAEALPHLRQAMDQVEQLPPGPHRDRLQLSVLASAGLALIATRGYADPEVQHVFDRAHTLVGVVGDDDELLPILLGLLTFHLARGRVAKAEEIAARRIPLARQRDDPDALRQAIVSHAFTLFYLGRLGEADAALREAAAIQPRDAAGSAGQLFNPDSSVYRGRAVVEWLRGDAGAARKAADDGVRLARTLPSAYGVAAALAFAAVVACWDEDLETATRYAGECLALATERGYPFWIPFATILDAWAAGRAGLRAGDPAAATQAVSRMTAQLNAFAAAGTELWRPYFLSLVADLQERTDRAEEAVRALDEAAETARRTGEMFWVPEILRRRAALTADDEAAADLLRQARELATAHGADALMDRLVSPPGAPERTST